MDNSSVQASEDNNVDNASNANVSPLPKLSWSRRVEYILSKWADGASCFKWLHEQSFRKFKNKNNWFSIPVIILSTLTGALNVGMQGYVPSDYMGYAQIGVGAVNIFAGVLTTLQSKFQYAELSEGHFQAFVGWSRLSRLISNELSLERSHRRNPNDLVKICKMEYERLMEQSPLVPKDIVDNFERKFGKKKELLFPDIADHIDHMDPYDDIKERRDREKDEKELRRKEKEDKDFIVHKQTSRRMTEEERINAINRWKSLKDVITAKDTAVSVEASPRLEPAEAPEIPPLSLVSKQSITSRTPLIRQRAPSVPPLPLSAPGRRSPPLPSDVRVNVKELARNFGSVFQPRLPPQTPSIQQTTVSRSSSLSSIRSSRSTRSTPALDQLIESIQPSSDPPNTTEVEKPQIELENVEMVEVESEDEITAHEVFEENDDK